MPNFHSYWKKAKSVATSVDFKAVLKSEGLGPKLDKFETEWKALEQAVKKAMAGPKMSGEAAAKLLSKLDKTIEPPSIVLMDYKNRLQERQKQLKSAIAKTLDKATAAKLKKESDHVSILLMAVVKIYDELPDVADLRILINGHSQLADLL